MDEETVVGVALRYTPGLLAWSVLQLLYNLLVIWLLSNIHSVVTLATNGYVGDLGSLVLEYYLVQASSHLNHEAQALLCWNNVQPLGYHRYATHLVLNHGHIVEKEMLDSLTGWNIGVTLHHLYLFASCAESGVPSLSEAVHNLSLPSNVVSESLLLVRLCHSSLFITEAACSYRLLCYLTLEEAQVLVGVHLEETLFHLRCHCSFLALLWLLSLGLGLLVD